MVYDIDGTLLGKMLDKISQDKVFGFMKLAINKIYKNNLENYLSAFTKILNALDRLSGEQKILMEKKARAEAHPSAKSPKEIAQVDARMADIDKEMAALDEQEKALIAFEKRKEDEKNKN